MTGYVWTDMLWIFPLAVLMDLWWGDPPLPWRHPVCWIGQLVDRLEPWARRCGGSRGAGACCVALVLVVTGVSVWAVISLPGILGKSMAVYLSWAGLATGSLLRAGEATLGIYEKGDLTAARTGLSCLVSRDTRVQGWEELHKSLADTMAENVTDACAAPCFWLILGGPVLLWIYKAVSTFDSMWGYRTPQWLRLGWAGARLDDLFAWIPARFSVCALWLAARIWPVAPHWGGRWPGFGIVARQASGMSSPNSGWPMAAASWLVGARMGGPAVYFGERVLKPWVGVPAAEDKGWDASRLRELFHLLRHTSLVVELVCYLCWICVWLLLTYPLPR